MHRFPPCLRPFALISAFVALAAAAAAADAIYLVQKGQVYFQNSATGSALDPVFPFTFGANALTSATLTPPAGGTAGATPLVFSAGNQDYEFNASFLTKAALDAAYPLGLYKMTGSGLPTLSFDLTTELYPTGTPAVIGGTWNAGGLLVVNPAQATTINLSTFSTYATAGQAGHMTVQLSGVTDQVNLKTDIASLALFGSGATTTPITTITIPAGLLTSGRVYQGSMGWDTIATLDVNATLGAGVVSLFSKSVYFYVAAQAPGTTTPAPVISTQPTSQVSPVGGSATFTLGFNSSPNNSAFWFFNGQQLDLGNNFAKYTYNNGSLVVKNITAADVGTYYAVVVSAGGIATSNSVRLTIGTPSVPVIASQPAALSVATGSSAVFTVVANGTGTLSYQWLKNNQALAGAPNSSRLWLQNTSANDVGAYSVRVSNNAGSAVSTPAQLNVVSTPNPGHLVNLSILTTLATGETMSMGTVLGGTAGTGTKSLLVRAVGPSLAPFSIANFLPDPRVALISGGATVGSNDNWNGTQALLNAFAQTGAFGFVSPTSKDAALFQTGLSSGNFSAQVSDTGTGSGSVIAELYDGSPNSFDPTAPHLINVSVLKQIAAGSTLSAGFVINGNTAKTVLVRAIGPGIAVAPFNIPGAMVDPQLSLVSSGTQIAANDNWGGDPQLVAANGAVGAFALANSGSADAIILITLPPGSYSAQANGANGTGGYAIVEVYEVP